MMGVFAFLLAAATPAADARAADAALVALHDSVCIRQAEPDADFRPVTRSDVPTDAAGMYIGPSEGRYWRRAGPLPAFVALSRGPGHWGGVEEQCVVAVQGARFEPVTATFAQRMRIRWIYGRDGRLQTWERWGLTNVTLTAPGQTTVMVTQRPGGWVSLFSGGMVTAQTQRPSR